MEGAAVRNHSCGHATVDNKERRCSSRPDGVVIHRHLHRRRDVNGGARQRGDVARPVWHSDGGGSEGKGSETAEAHGKEYWQR